MSHQTGITANEELLKIFVTCRGGSIRVLTVHVENEDLVMGDWLPAESTWENDYDAKILPMLQENQPCYVLYRLDSKIQGAYQWLLISWSPDDSPIRQKMLYASTKATLKKEFGPQITDEIFGNTIEDVNLEGLRRHQSAEAAPAPLTLQEEEINEMKKLEVGVDIGIDTRHQTLSGVAFPINRDARQALNLFSEGKIQYIQLKIDVDKEEINLSEKEGELPLSALPTKIPESNARYHLYRYDHSYEGDFFYSVLFIYSMPGYSCPIKERMLYSSSKNPVTEHIENVVNVNITKKLEIGGGDELTEEYLLDEIHPKKNLHRPKFSKPKGPANRGARRLTKGPKEGELPHEEL